MTRTAPPGQCARIGIVDDHPAVLLGAAGILRGRPGLQVVAATETVTGLLSRTTDLDLVLLDLVLADGSTPAQNISRLTRLHVPVLAFTSGDRPEVVREAARAGAIGMIRKSERPDAIVAAIGAALRHEVVATADWAAALDDDEAFVAARLTAREAEVLALYASGETARRVADQLFISRETVLDHIQRIRAKYAAVDRPARSKVELYQRAVEDGFLPGAQPDAASG
ncbi:MAG TPA: response regulator transcription factor [Arachnia sp.]|nr:response regulator transcription factor [Arachnia sp.]HMT86296.1 response regulator transcription factor [Arachnia sp.]